MDKKKILFIAISVLVCLLVYIPTPKGIDPEQYSPAQPVNLDDLQISKDKLRNAVYINTPAEGAQDVQIDKQGFIYSGLHDGSIVKINPSNSEIKVVARSQGPIFGLDLNKKGDKIAIADQTSGIKILDLKSGQFQHVASQYNGVKFASPNAVVFGQNDQELFFTVSSQKIPMSDFHEMLLYSEGSGKIFSYNLKQKKLEVLADNLYFVNGLEFSPKDNCLYFIETSRSRLSKLELSSLKRGNTTIITDNILGYPDNVKLTESGDLWIAVPALRDSFSNIIDHNSIIRRIILNLRMPLGMFMTLANMKYAGGIRVNPKTKQVVQYFFGNSDYINCISGINEKDGKLYLSSLSQNKIAVVDLNQNMENKAEKIENIVEKIDQIQVNTAEEKIIKQEQKVQQTIQKAAVAGQEVITETIEKQVQKVEKNQQQVNEIKQKIQKAEQKLIGKQDTALNKQKNQNTDPEHIQIIENAQFFKDLENEDEALINKLEDIKEKVEVQQVKPSSRPATKPTYKTTKPQMPTTNKAPQGTSQKTTQSSTTNQKARQSQSSQQARSSQQKGSTGRPQYSSNQKNQNTGYGRNQNKRQGNYGNQQL